MPHTGARTRPPRRFRRRGEGDLAADESTGTIKQCDSIRSASSRPRGDSSRAYRNLLFTTPGAEEFISGVILYDETIRQSDDDDGTPPPRSCSRPKGIIPGIKGRRGRQARCALAEGETQ